MLVETRPYRAGDEAAILDLFAKSFPHAPRSLAHFNWKFRGNPAGNERISLTFAGERLVAHYAGYPVLFDERDRELVAQQIGDTMTDPSVRHIGRGASSILGRTALHFYERFCEGQIAFNYGFNVANIQKFSLRFLRSDRVEPVTYRVRDARTIRPISRAERLLRGYRLRIVTSATSELDQFYARVRDAYRFLARRDARYIRWRYLEHPESPYVVVAIHRWHRLAGWIALRIRDNRLMIGDALFDPSQSDAFEVALRHIVPGYPVDSVEAWFPPRPLWFDEVVRASGFETRPEPQDLSLMCVPFTMADATERMRAELYYTWGDSDLF
jgi:hypothetical protein